MLRVALPVVSDATKPRVGRMMKRLSSLPAMVTSSSSGTRGTPVMKFGPEKQKRSSRYFS
jgi:hypothetical protein